MVFNKKEMDERNKKNIEKMKGDFQKIKSHSGKIKWVVGLFLIISGLIFISSPSILSILAGILYLSSGFLITPFVHNKIVAVKQLKYFKNKYINYGSVILLIIVAGSLVNKAKESEYIDNKSSIFSDIQSKIEKNDINGAASVIAKYSSLQAAKKDMDDFDLKIKEKQKSTAKNLIAEVLFKKPGYWTLGSPSQDSCETIRQNDTNAREFISYSENDKLILMRVGEKNSMLQDPNLNVRKNLTKTINVPIEIKIVEYSHSLKFDVASSLYNGAKMIDHFQFSSDNKSLIQYKKTDCIKCSEVQEHIANLFDGPVTRSFCEGDVGE